MRKGWKRMAAILGGAVLVCSQYEAFPTKAEEAPQQVVGTTEETDPGEAGSSAAQTQAAQLQAASDLSWNENGQGVFNNPNTGRTFSLRAYVYGPGIGEEGRSFNAGVNQWAAGEITLDLYHYMTETGTYTFKVVMADNSGTAESAVSGGFEYVKPNTQLPKPVVSVNKSGLVSCALPENNDGTEYTLGTDYGFNYELYFVNGSGKYERVLQRGTDRDTFDFGTVMTSDRVYYVRVRTLSRDIMRLVDSEWSDMIPVDSGSAGDIPTGGQETEEEGQEPEGEEREEVRWEPSTPDELKRYAACGGEEVIYTTDAKNAYDIKIQNSVQGEMCFASFDAVLGGYTIGRTYNIFPSDGIVYRMDSKARITLTVPEALRADNRRFRMISVTENGRPIVLEDLDSDPETITFETDTYYAYALIYKDGAGSKAKTK